MSAVSDETLTGPLQPIASICEWVVLGTWFFLFCLRNSCRELLTISYCQFFYVFLFRSHSMTLSMLYVCVLKANILHILLWCHKNIFDVACSATELHSLCFDPFLNRPALFCFLSLNCELCYAWIYNMKLISIFLIFWKYSSVTWKRWIHVLRCHKESVINNKITCSSRESTTSCELWCLCERMRFESSHPALSLVSLCIKNQRSSKLRMCFYWTGSTSEDQF